MKKDPVKWDGKGYSQVRFGDIASIKGTAKEAEMRCGGNLLVGEMLTREHGRRSKQLAMQDCRGRSVQSASSWMLCSDDHRPEGSSHIRAWLPDITTGGTC